MAHNQSSIFPQSAVRISEGVPPDEDDSRSQQLVQAVERALRILRCFSAESLEWSFADLVKHSGLRRTTALRLVKTLETEGLIALSAETGKYALGPLVLDMAYVLMSDAQLARIATPHMERLAEITSASAGLTIWSGDGPLCIAHSPSPQPFAHMMSIGQRLHHVASAHSKVLLAFGPESRRLRYTARPIEPRTPYTVMDSGRFSLELDHVGIEGVARDLQGYRLGVVAVAVPVWDCTNQVRASLSIVVPESRYGANEDRAWVQALKQIAADISFELGYRANHDLVSSSTRDHCDTQ